MLRDRDCAHLLIIRLSAMGDVAMTVPVVKSLRSSYPDLRITVLTRSFFAPFFRDIEGIDFLYLDSKGRHKGLFGIIRLYRDILACGVTQVADLHDVLRTKILRFLFRLQGFSVSKIDKGRSDKRALTRKFRKFKIQLTPTIQRYIDTVSNLGYRIDLPAFAKRTDRSVPAEIESLTGIKDGKWIGVAPFAQHKGKIYPTAKMAELIERLSEIYDYVFIFGGGPYEKEYGDYISGLYKNVISVIGKIKLAQELDLISNLDLMICMDSSAMHMSSLEGIPAVSIWGATHPYAGFYGFGQAAENAVQLDLACRPCSIYGNKACLYGDYRCLSGISTYQILDKVSAVLNTDLDKSVSCARH